MPLPLHGMPNYSPSPVQVVDGNHERDWPQSGALVFGLLAVTIALWTCAGRLPTDRCLPHAPGDNFGPHPGSQLPQGAKPSQL